MKKFDELVYPFDRRALRIRLKNEIKDNVTLCRTAYFIKPIDVLIEFAKRIKYEYVNNKRHYGMCSAKGEALYYMNMKHPSHECWILNSWTLDSIIDSTFKDYAGHYPEWLEGRESGYWWHIYYSNSKEEYYNPYKSANIIMARLAKPRILFLDWVINVLIAYKNEYNNV